MIFPYMLRFFCLCLACFFLVHLALGLLVSLTAAVANLEQRETALGYLSPIEYERKHDRLSKLA